MRWIILIVAVVFGSPAWAEEPKKKKVNYKLELKAAPKLPNGRAAAVKGRAIAEPDTFFVEHIGVLQPVVVTLIAKKKGDAITVRLGKNTFDEKLREATTGADGQTTIKLRTQGELKLSVFAKDTEPLPYFLLVWVGDEIKPVFKPAVVPMASYKAGGIGGAGSKTGIVVGIGVALVAVALLAFVIRRRLRGAQAVTVIALLAIGTARADGPSAISFDELWQQYEGDRTRREVNEQRIAGLTQGIEWGRMGVQAVQDAAAFYQAYEALTAGDANCIDLGDLGAPQIPTNCHQDDESEGGCAQCFMSAYRRLDGMRLNLERLRCTYSAAKAFTDAAIAFGDNASGIHAVTGLAWQAERRQIVAAFTQLQQTYDTKYSQMMPNLKSSLEAIGECEGRFFNENDWFQRFGFIYFSFMRDRYRRAD